MVYTSWIDCIVRVVEMLYVIDMTFRYRFYSLAERNYFSFFLHSSNTIEGLKELMEFCISLNEIYYKQSVLG